MEEKPKEEPLISIRNVMIIIVVVAIVLVIVLAILAALGPTIGNIFSDDLMAL